MAKPFGYLLTLDLYNCKDGACNDIRLCFDYLIQLVDKLKMVKQSPPFLFENNEYPGKEGISAWIPLVESGVQLHSLRPKRFISIDIYSCREFDPDLITEWSREYFGSDKAEVNFMERGKEYWV